MLARVAVALGLVALVVRAVIGVTRPPAAVPATAADSVFSAERAMRHVQQIAQRPHGMGTADHDRVRDYILAQLESLGLPGALQTTTALGTRYQEAGRVQNIVAHLPGSAPSAKAVLLMVHYDGVGAAPAAADDGAGVAAVLETLRALKARRTPLKQDVIALFTDGEESGLLGAAAFVREHPDAKRVGVALNFEARGTAGRAFMFETGPGNLDVARALRGAGDVTAGSIFVTVYRTLPNDTDLSELSQLNVPALNFAFTQGVERYHTSRDDVGHLDPGSLQHHGQQMLALAKTFASGDLPRPVTADGVFFDLPMLGLVVYPIWLAHGLAALVLVLIILVLPEMKSAAAPGFLAMLVGVVICGVAASRVRFTGQATWSGEYAAVIALAAVAINAAIYLRVARRWPNAYAGALFMWGLFAIGLSIVTPTISYIFTWPVLFALVAARSRSLIAEWIAAAMTILMVGNLAYGASAIMLGVSGAGAIALAVVASLITWLLAPLVARVFPDWRYAFGIPLGSAILVGCAAHASVKPNDAHPNRTAIGYAENADTDDAWIGANTSREPWTHGALGDVTRGPSWTWELGPYRQTFYGHRVARVGLDSPIATIASDSNETYSRVVTLHVTAPRGTTALVMRAFGARVLRAKIDGVEMKTTRFRRQLPDWQVEYWNVPPEGVTLELTLPSSSGGTLALASRSPGLPTSIALPKRPEWAAASQDGDVSVVYRQVKF